MKVKKQSHHNEDDKLTIEDVIQLGGDQVGICHWLKHIGDRWSECEVVNLIEYNQQWSLWLAVQLGCHLNSTQQLNSTPPEGG